MPINLDLITYAVIAALVLALAFSSLRIVREYERVVVFTLGRFTGVKGPGLIILIPFVQQAVRVDLRTIVLDVPSQDVISHDNVSVKVNAVLYFRVVDADKAVIQVENFMVATSQLAQTTLRSVLGKHELDEMLAERDKLNRDIQSIIDSQTDAWGIKVANVEIKHVDIDGGAQPARPHHQCGGRTTGRRKTGRGGEHTRRQSRRHAVTLFHRPA
jgi:regulator of protease activity HflC (stomatin/prohibitin superfamily)